MKRVMTGVVVAVAVVAGGVSGTAAAAEPQPQQRQDCRTYSGATQCGDLRLDEKQRTCVTSSVQLGMTERRAEVECHAFS